MAIPLRIWAAGVVQRHRPADELFYSPYDESFDLLPH